MRQGVTTQNFVLTSTGIFIWKFPKFSSRNPNLQPYDILGTASLRARQSHKNMWKINCHRLHNHPEYQKFMEDEAALKCYGLTVLIFYNE